MADSVPMDLLEQFVALAETRSFSIAARKLGVTKGTVSRGLARLEDQLGNELVHRTTRQVSLSTAGQALYERVAPHLSALKQAVCSLPELEEQPSGELRITAPTDFGIEILPEVIAGFALRYPAIQVDAHITNRVVDLVGEGFDLAIRAISRFPLRDSAMVARPLARVEMQFYAAPTYVARRGSPRAVTDGDHDWVVLGQARQRNALPKGVRPRVVGDDFFFIRELLRHGGGVGMLPTFLADPYVVRGDLVRVLPSFRQRGQGKLMVMYPSARRIARKVDAFRDHLVETLAASSRF